MKYGAGWRWGEILSLHFHLVIHLCNVLFYFYATKLVMYEQGYMYVILLTPAHVISTVRSSACIHTLTTLQFVQFLLQLIGQ